MNKHFSQKEINFNMSRATNDIDPTIRLRNTLLMSEWSRSSQQMRLRNSCSAKSMKYFDLEPFQPIQQQPTGMKTLKETLEQLETKVDRAKKLLQKVSATSKRRNEHLKTQKIQEQPDMKPSQSSITHKKGADCKITTMITTVPKPVNFKVADRNPYSLRRNNVYYVSEAIRAANQKNSLAVEHLNASIRMIKACEHYESEQTQVHKLDLKQQPFYKGKKTLVLDLDETLIHCYQNAELPSDLKLSITIEGEPIEVGLNIRPYALTFLKKMAKRFQIMIFTASHQIYANAILDQIDPEGQIFQHRLYRHHCEVLENELHVKDLRIINRPPKDMVLVDNAAYSYALQLENGIPILPYYEGKDFQLAALESYLLKLENVEDVREVNKRTFKLHHYSKFDSAEELIEQLYTNTFDF